METPLYDFVRRYVEEDFSRLHMPGHKGRGPLGCESLDITEIKGADSLYQAAGIIARSEQNAAQLFGAAATFYATEGSSQCIRAMLYLALLATRTADHRPMIVASRNAHQTFILTAALLDYDIVWLWPEEQRFSLCRCAVSPQQLERTLSQLPAAPAAVYVTSPDYLGGTLDIAALASVSHTHDIPLLVDNAHGAYLHFLQHPAHPLDLGADLCCDSAHKTLPVLTGGAYLHLAATAPRLWLEQARRALALFGSTSPSYLILQSLDLANRYLAQGYCDQLARCIARLTQLKTELRQAGWVIADSEPLKLTLAAGPSGHSGGQLAELLRRAQVESEYADPDWLALMFTPENQERDFVRIARVLGRDHAKRTLPQPELTLPRPEIRLTPRQALFAATETVDAAAACGRILAAPSVSCPPAVPVVMSGELITPEAVEIFRYYGIERLTVVK